VRDEQVDHALLEHLAEAGPGTGEIELAVARGAVGGPLGDQLREAALELGGSGGALARRLGVGGGTSLGCRVDDEAIAVDRAGEELLEDRLGDVGVETESAAAPRPLLRAMRPPNTPKKLATGGSKSATAEPDGYGASNACSDGWS
jgi:hypothetical protein